MKIFTLPDLGEGLLEAEISQWYVKEGDIVKEDDPLVAMETAKSLVDVPAPYSGKIIKLYGQAHDIINTGAPLAAFVNEQETLERTDPIVGKIENGESSLVSLASMVPLINVDTKQIKVLPAVRALANQLQVDLARVVGTGANGRITADDVKRTQATSSTTTIEILGGTRRAMNNTMAKSHAGIVPATLMEDADIHSWAKDADITYRVLRALVFACKAEPTLNAHFNKQTLERTLYTTINVGIAMDSPEGLFVPVIKQAEKLNINEIRIIINRFKQQVLERNIAAEDLQGATIYLSNFGVFAGRYATPIIVPPSVAILAIGKIRLEVMAMNNNTFAGHRTMPLSLTIDHSVVTGGEAARFLKYLIADLQCVI